MEMEFGESKGFHGYRRPPPPPTSSSGIKQSVDINNDDNNNNDNNDDNNECIVREQDRFMPIANVIRIMRKILPPHAKISDDAKETIQECVSEYISFITSEANERCQKEQRKTITAEDVLWAMDKLGFDDYIEPLTFYLNRYRDIEGGDRGSLRSKPQLPSQPVGIRVVGPDPNGRVGQFTGPSFGPMGGFQYHTQNQHQHPSGVGVGASCNEFHPQMVGFIKEAPGMASSSSQAMASIENHGQFGQGKN